MKQVTAVLAVIGTISTGIFFAVDFFAHAKDLNNTDSRLNRVEKKVDVAQLQYQKRDLWDEKLFLKKQIRKNPQDQELKDELEKVEEQLKEVKTTIQQLSN
jgi:peptidoglycan hydrolase CwlO-like protein